MHIISFQKIISERMIEPQMQSIAVEPGLLAKWIIFIAANTVHNNSFCKAKFELLVELKITNKNIHRKGSYRLYRLKW